MGQSVLLQADLCLALNPRTTLTLPVPAPSPPLLQACDQRQSQLTMDQFLGFNQRFAKIRSKRLQKAVTAITGGAGDPSELYLADVSAMPDIHVADGEAAVSERGGEGDEEGDEDGQRPRRMPGDEEFVAVVVPMQGAVTATAAAAGKLLPTKVAGKPPTAAREKAQGKRKRASGSQGPSGGRGRGRK